MSKPSRCTAAIAIFLICFFAPFVRSSPEGKIYQWTDPSGIKHFSNIAHPASDIPVQIFREKEPSTDKIDNSDQTPALLKNSTLFKVIKVYDGDSLKVQGQGLTLMVRLVGIDAPETRHRGVPGQPFSQKAKKRLQELTKGTKISLISHGTGLYNRQLAEVIARGVHVNLRLLEEGLAEVYRGRMPQGVDRALFLKAEARAKKRKKGIWSLGRSYESPREWRRRHPR